MKLASSRSSREDAVLVEQSRIEEQKKPEGHAQRLSRFFGIQVWVGVFNVLAYALAF